MKAFLKRHLISILLTVVLFAGIGLLLYPTAADWWNGMHQAKAIVTYVEQIENIEEDVREEMLETARSYNRELERTGARYVMTEAEKTAYEAVLDVDGSGIMGYIQIPSVNISLPIYHGTEEKVLQHAVGHIAGSSVPAGGEGTHTVVSGHRGLPSARLFTDIDKLKEGDRFMISVLSETLIYQVDQIRTVEPADMSEVQIVPGRDYCTLVTCTPYSVNTHRLLVRGSRIREEEDDTVYVTHEAVKIPSFIVIPAVLIPLLLLVLTGMLVYYWRKKPPLTKEEKRALVFGEENRREMPDSTDETAKNTNSPVKTDTAPDETDTAPDQLN